MRILLQRVAQASVTVSQQQFAEIGQGLLLLVGFTDGDDELGFQNIAERIVNLRVFSDPNGRFQFSSLDINADILVVPQFTLYGNTRKGRRPDFLQALSPKPAAELFNRFAQILETNTPGRFGKGSFGDDMQVALINDGPVTLMLDY